MATPAACTPWTHLAARRAADRRHLRGADAGRGGGEAGSHHRPYRRSHPSYAERERCGVVRDFCGHGLGRVFHDRPNILHYGEPGDGVVLEPGMLFTIEPMINLGKPHVKILPDGWTAVTRDRELSAQFEHTVGVTETGCRVSRFPRWAFIARPIGSPERLRARRGAARAASTPGAAFSPGRTTGRTWRPTPASTGATRPGDVDFPSPGQHRALTGAIARAL